jgi:UDP-3-O-[3-hydroxymyristoyl] glucosamine N-acyltransferase
LTNYFKPFQFSNVSIATSASIGEGTTAKYIYWKSCVIGKNCLIHSNVSIYDHTIIGDNVIHAGTILGRCLTTKNALKDMTNYFGGRVVIKDNVGIEPFVQLTKV